MRWSIRPLDPVADRGSLAILWVRALPRAWPLLPDSLALLRRGHVAQVGTDIVGAVAIDRSILFIAVEPSHQRRGLGSVLLDHALGDLEAEHLEAVPVGTGGAYDIWPGVPTDLAAAFGFFSKHGWHWDDTATDMVMDLRTSPADDLVRLFPPPTGVEVSTVEPRHMSDVLAFETRHFPFWARWYTDSAPVLVARNGGRIRGALLVEGPGPVHQYWPILGEDCGTIACVGVDPDHEGTRIGSALVARATGDLAARGVGNCLIPWTDRIGFYRRLGYSVWREYHVGSRPLAR
jgi:ribosomal protein S18 acetylase RimI-like enzyme